MESLRKPREPTSGEGSGRRAAAGVRRCVRRSGRSHEQSMASNKTMAMEPSKKSYMAWLPQDIVELILVRLPVSTLLRCRGVCKQWDRIIRDTQFGMAHIRCAPCRPLIFFRQENLGQLLYPCEAILFDEAWSPSKWDIPVIEPDDFLCASCNGLICLYSTKSTIKIANLATGECMHLAKPVRNSKTDHFSYYSFGFHPVTKQYKVMHCLRDEQLHDGTSFSTIQVYTLGDEKWRDVRTPQALSLRCVERSGAVNVDGAMYWLTEDAKSVWKRVVVAFDLSEELFWWLQLPLVDPASCMLGNPDQLLITVTDIDGKLSVATRSYSGLIGKMHIWTFDSKLEQRWIQKCTIRLSVLNVPGPHWICGDKIILHDFYRNLHFYELMEENSEIELSKIVKLLDFSPRQENNMQCFMFAKSLVRLDAFRKAGVVRRPKRQEGWKLKKWEVWMGSIHRLEKYCRRSCEMQHKISECADKMGIKINLILQQLPDLASSLQPINWVEYKRVLEILSVNLDNMHDVLVVMTQAAHDAHHKENTHVADQGASSSAVDRSGS
ncbi:F-box protein At3g07870-like isoform X1 [Oryza brachyantha]|uniref:F-box protein At3g07870-like isoform X1 n=2 Tax=Oryza brachyantha TaxID=4533 RepID=UPI0007766B7A|nr:F-box protein At3g07870-like isoform X1 [Oryza brachyantha]